MISGIGSADIGAQIAMMETQLGQDDKRTSAAMRQSAEDQEDAADKQELSAMSSKTNAAFAGSMISAAGDFASAGFSAHSADVMSDNIGALQGSDARDAMSAVVKSDDARSQLYGAFAKLGAAGATLQANDDDTDIAQAKQTETHAEREIQDANDFKKSEEDGIGKALDFAQGYEQAQNAATMAAIRA